MIGADPGFLRRLAGHLENRRDSVSDPAFGSAGQARTGREAQRETMAAALE
jgi:hypothetical protein